MWRALLVLIASLQAGEMSNSKLGALTGNGWMILCKDTHSDMCEFYTQGVIEGMRAAFLWESKRDFFCPSQDVTLSQTIKVIQKSISDSPKIMHYQSTILIREALQDAFPCDPKPTSP